MSNPKLFARLRQVRQFDGVFGHQLSNHLPMALIALDRLHASEEATERFYAAYAARLRPKAPLSEAMTEANWQTRRGQHQAHGDFEQFFAAELNRLGSAGLLATWLPKLLPGIAGGAFHGLIRLGYALDAGDADEVVAALAHWADVYLEFRAQPVGPVVGKTLLENLADARANPLLAGQTWPGALIHVRIASVFASPAFAAFARTVNPGEHALPDIARLAVQLYITTGNFTVLHLVTSCHALRLVLAHCPNLSSEALRHFWLAALAAYVTIGGPEPLALASVAHLPEWGDIAAVAASSPNDHTIKLVYTCMQEELVYAGAAYRQAASIATRLLKS